MFKNIFGISGGEGVLPLKKTEKFKEDVLEKISEMVDNIDDLIDENGIPMSVWQEVQKHTNTIMSELHSITSLLK